MPRRPSAPLGYDYDAPSPTVLFDVEIDGKLRHGIAEAEKTGWLYLLDRETGKPLFPIPERPVAQEPNQKTAKTQPISSYPAFIPHRPSSAQMKQIAQLAIKNARSSSSYPGRRAERTGSRRATTRRRTYSTCAHRRRPPA